MRARILLILIVTLSAATAAQGRDPERASRLHRSESAWLPPAGLLLVGVDASFATTDWSDGATSIPVEEAEYALQADWGCRPGVRFHGRIPWRSRSGQGWLGASEDAVSGLGDAEFGLLLSPWRPAPWLALALDLRTTLATGDTGKGLGAGKASSYYGLAATGRFWPEGPAPEMRLHLRAGRLDHPDDGGAGGLREGVLTSWPDLYPAAMPGGDGNDPLVLGAALEFRRGDARLFVEWTRYRYATSLAAAAEQPEFLTGGLRWGGETGPAVTVTYDVALCLDDPDTAFRPTLPDMTLGVGLSWSLPLGGRDRDGDGLVDRVDPCPDAAEDLDGWQDEDGCPDLDNDGDGVPDARDLAPDSPEDLDGWLDRDGVPDPDNDADGVPDARDDCPDVPEDADGHQDEDGCPEEFLDRDEDGIPDERDVCPDAPEDLDGFRDEDGCPDPDNDLDGIPDVDDACPDTPEDYDGVEDDDGCPED